MTWVDQLINACILGLGTWFWCWYLIWEYETMKGIRTPKYFWEKPMMNERMPCSITDGQQYDDPEPGEYRGELREPVFVRDELPRPIVDAEDLRNHDLKCRGILLHGRLVRARLLLKWGLPL